MKLSFVCLGVFLCIAVSNAQNQDEPLLKQADVHALIREAAVKIEQKLKGASLNWVGKSRGDFEV